VGVTAWIGNDSTADPNAESLWRQSREEFHRGGREGFNAKVQIQIFKIPEIFAFFNLLIAQSLNPICICVHLCNL
jgi:hypothetical protein